MKFFKENTRVKTYHVDKNGRLGTPQIFNFLQEIAYRHSYEGKFGQPDLAELDMVWMLSRIKLQLLHIANLGDEIEVRSWVRSIVGALSERDFSIRSKGMEIARATSLWACLSKKTIKPQHIPSQFLKRMHINSHEELNFTTSKVAPLKTWDAESVYQVKMSDIDMVNHTNNVAYVRMALDAYKTERIPAEIDVNFIRQSYLDDTLIIRQFTKGELSHHEIVSGDESVFRMKVVWRTNLK